MSYLSQARRVLQIEISGNAKAAAQPRKSRDAPAPIGVSRWLVILQLHLICRGMICAEPNFYEMPLEELEKHASAGEIEAEFALGAACEYGKGRKADPAAAFIWYQKAAAQGYGRAMRALGHCYEEGKGVLKDITQAVQWYQKASGARGQTFAESDLLRLSKAGLTTVKYAGVPCEGRMMLSTIDEKTPLEQLVPDLSNHTNLRETGKAYWIGYNEQMLSIAAQGDAAIPLLVALAKDSAKSAETRSAAILTLHLIGIESEVTGRFEENFRNRKAREALWELLCVDGLTDEVAMLLKRDPWVADLIAYMRAFQTVTGDCPLALNALDSYAIPDRPMDTLRGVNDEKRLIHFTTPKQYDVATYARVAIEGIRKESPEKVTVEERMFHDLESQPSGTRGNPTPTEQEIALDKLVIENLKDLSPVFSFCSAGNAIYYYVDISSRSSSLNAATLVFCSAQTAKLRWLDWWQTDGEKRYTTR